MFVDWPNALCLYNHFRKHWCARFWQDHGIHVIPTINWMFEDSWEWCFDGEPENAIVAVSSKGIIRDRAMVDMFQRGYEEMERRLHPMQVLWFGKYCLDEPRDNVVMCRVENDERLERVHAEWLKKQQEDKSDGER